MKLLIFVAVVVPAFVAVRATGKMENLTNGFARVFEIKKEDVEKCINDKAATAEDFRLLEDVIGHSTILKSEDANILDEADRRSIKRATCVVSCCAQKQGSMIGSQIQMPIVYDMIKKATIPGDAKLLLTVVVNECNEEVKEITDECDVAFGFVNCVVLKVQNTRSR